MSLDDDFKKEMDPLKAFFERKMKDPGIPQSVKNDLQILMTSHLRQGTVLRFRGLLREALQEFEKEMDRPISTSIDAEIVESAFWQMGNAYRQLGEIEKALAAYEKALELIRKYRVGVSPHEDLAELYLEQQRIDEAIALCQECLERWPSGGAKQLLAKAMTLKSGDSGQAND